MKTLKMWSHVVTISLWAVTIVLAYYGLIPWWFAVLIIIAVMFLSGYITLFIVRAILGSERFRELVLQARDEKNTEERVKEIVARVNQQVVQEMGEIIQPLEAEFASDMKNLSTESELGYQKGCAAYLAGEGDSDYKRYMKQWCQYLAAILVDKNDCERAQKLRATLEQEYQTAMAEWDKAQIAKLLAKE